MKGIIYILLHCTAFLIAVSCSELLPPEPEQETVLAGPIEDLTPQQWRLYSR